MSTTFPNGAKVSTTLGEITDLSGNMLLKVWNAEVPSGKLLFNHHNHTGFEITVVNSGSGTYSTDNGIYPMSAGDVFVFSSNEFHCITQVGENGLKLTNLHFEPRYLWGDSENSFSEENINMCFFHSKDFKNRITANASKTLLTYMEGIKNEITLKPIEYRLKVKSLLNLFLISLVRDFGYLDKDTSVSSIHLKNLQNILTFIDEHFTQRISLEQLADKAGMSPNYFSSFFKKISGINLWDYINNKRINYALNLLRNSNKNILEIAMLCGFNNTTHFNKMFKRVSGMTPTEYRKNTNLFIH